MRLDLTTFDGDNITKLLVDSPDSLIRYNHNINRADSCQPDVYGLNSGNKFIEIKSPYPDENNMPVHYSIPRYYILQCIIHMIVTNTIEIGMHQVVSQVWFSYVVLWISSCGM